MIIGGTPLHEFELDLAEMPNIVEVLISYTQNGRVILRKKLKDCTLEGNKLSVRLTQEDTLKFTEDHKVRIQIKLKTDEGRILPSEVMVTPTSRCLDLEVI